MFYKNNTTGTFGHTLAEVRRAYPNKSIPVDATTIGEFVGYTPSPRPVPNWNENVVEVAPVDGVQQWMVIPCSTEEAENRTNLQSEAIRAQRDQLLAECDWTQLSDIPLDADKVQEWKTYRQALRDLPLQPGFPWTIEWPVEPEK